MAENVLIINSSPHSSGHTARLCNAFAEGLEQSGKKYTLIDVAAKKISPCIGCGVCRHNGGMCSIRDDMDAVYESFAVSDGLVLASPMYFFTCNAQMKAVIDRLYAIGVNIGFQYPAREIAFFMTAGENLADTFDVADLFYERALNRIFGTWRDRGRIYVGGLANPSDAISGHPALEKARDLGRNF